VDWLLTEHALGRAGPASLRAGQLGDAPESIRPAGVSGSQAFVHHGDLLLGCRQRRGAGSEPPAQRSGVLDPFSKVRSLMRTPPAAVRNSPVNLGLFPLAGHGLALDPGLFPLTTVPAGCPQLAGAVDGLTRAPALGVRASPQFPGTLLKPLLLLFGFALPLIGCPVP
jgi:hypothetical protein